jgi:uncharacterized cupin superfamily protein
MPQVNGPVVIAQPARLPTGQLTDAGEARDPVGQLIPHFKRLGFSGEGLEKYRFGVWETTVGKWRRDVAEAEFCYILSGSATFTTDDNRSWTFGAGDTVFLPANCFGVWDVTEPLRKTFVVIPG